MKEVIIKVLKKALNSIDAKLSEEEIDSILEIPPSLDMGDYSFPCFPLAGKLKASPNEIALRVREAIGNPPSELDEVETSGPYVNFFIDRKNLAREIILEILKQKKNFGKSNVGNKEKSIVEFSSPNIAKPFGIGHLRSTIIGNSIANLSEFVGFKPVRLNYLGDWGTQFGKILFGYEKFGNEKKLRKDPINHLLEVYIKANKSEEYETFSKEAFKRLEEGDKASIQLWKLFKELSVKEFEKIYNLLGVEFDVYSGESDTIKNIPNIMKQLEDKKITKKSQGALIVDLKKMGVTIIKKSDETTTYAIRDLSAAIQRYEKYKFKSMIYQVGQEQKLYFQQIFKILELMGYEWAKDCIHSEHGLYLGSDGKKFATRKGKLVLMEDILDKTKALTSKEIKKRFPKISKKELESRALKVAIAAIFYGDLKNNKKNDVVFDLKKFTSFEGDTGPYLLYTYARATSILKKVDSKKEFELKELDQKELGLVKKLSQFPEIVLDAFTHLNPSLIATYAYQLSQKFNEFYQACPVINSEQEAFRLKLVESFRQVLENSLKLLGIEVLEEM